MTKYSAKSSKKADPRQQAREERKARNRAIAPERIAKVHIMADGRKLLELKPVQIPGYTYAF
ncbi:hypothetical protein [Hymenobacter metallilatus]|uniref:Uncharacterized protein n=1 Tax=Hymenobacter metallilatus TaxID=2493666 RepID=A0A3R9NK03_9BACT|nr:hypothetical protein [Hymenobacter metallilatus]RSK37547.1 hypothetical protein EI290_02560 [Hymenobacter metallilatus]